ncbi:MAG: S1 RNA-binding domain-containing protein [Nanoarchaeota archaeon]
MIKEKLEDYYQEGQLVEVEIVNVKDFGAFIITNDEKRIKGMIHKSETADAFVDNVKDYFEKGDVLEARIIEWEPKERQLSLSTKEFNLEKKPINNRHKNNKLLKFKRKLEEKENSTAETSQKKNANSVNVDEDEFNKIVKYLNGKIGVLSPNAKEKLIKIISKHGIFTFTRSLENVLEDFEIDFGVILSKKVEKDLEINKLVNYSISEHAVDNYIERSKKYFNNDLEDKNREDIKQSLQDMCYHGEVIVETDDIKYLKYGNWFLPCAKITDAESETWKIKSMMTWEMFEKNMQEKADKYMSM